MLVMDMFVVKLKTNVVVVLTKHLTAVLEILSVELIQMEFTLIVMQMVMKIVGMVFTPNFAISIQTIAGHSYQVKMMSTVKILV